MIRSIVQENRLHPSDFVLPIFVSDDEEVVEIPTMPGVFRWPTDQLGDQIKSYFNMGIRAFALFPKMSSQLKDPNGQRNFKSK